MNGMFQVNGTNLDFAIIQKQSRLQFTPYKDIGRLAVCIWSIILSKATFWIHLESCPTIKKTITFVQLLCIQL